MSEGLLGDAFGHHVWATLRVIDACLELDPGQLQTAVPGTYGSILDTLRHLVAADVSYLFVLSRERTPLVEADEMDLAQLRDVMDGHREAWASVLASGLDPTEVVVRHRDDGSETHAPIGIRLAQVVHHGTDHRSQICTALTALGVEPPAIDVWDFAAGEDRLVEVPPTT